MTERRFPVMVGVKISRELDAEIRRRAREDDRPVGAFVRRVLTKALQEHSDDKQQQLAAAGR